MNSWTIPNFCRARNIKSQCTLSYALAESNLNKTKDQLKCAFLMFNCAYFTFVIRTSENVKVCPSTYPPIFFSSFKISISLTLFLPPPQTFLGDHTIGTVYFVTKPICSTFILAIFSFLTLFLTILYFVTPSIRKYCCNLLSFLRFCCSSAFTKA